VPVPIEFKLEEIERPLGWFEHAGTPNELVLVKNAALIGPDNAQTLQDFLQRLHKSLFRHIPGLPDPHQIRQLIVLLRNDLTGVAYVNELVGTAMVRTAREVNPGPATVEDMASIEEVSYPIDIPDDVAVVVIHCAEWLRTLYFDFGPVAQQPLPRIGPIRQIIGAQLAMLWGVGKRVLVPERTRVDEMADGFQRLHELLEERCEREGAYQELLTEHPWMFGLGMYSSFDRHTAFDDKNVPDFTLRRTADGTDDFVEMKQPFLKYYTKKDEPTAELQGAWHQAERYLTFAHENRDYLRREKNIIVENPRCWLLIGTTWTAEQAKQIRIKETHNARIKVLTYDQLLLQAQMVLSVMRTALLTA
jgi:hypothetical protein